MGSSAGQRAQQQHSMLDVSVQGAKPLGSLNTQTMLPPAYMAAAAGWLVVCTYRGWERLPLGHGPSLRPSFFQ